MAHKKLGAQTKGTGRAALQFGGVAPVGGVGVAPVGSVGTARRDMRSGYYPDDMGMRGGPMYEKGGRVGLRSRTFKKGGRAGLKDGGDTARENRLEELGRVKAEKADTKKGKKNLTAEKKRIVKELKA
jgi:hypothetical protein